MAFSPDGSTAYVTNYGSGTVSVIARATNTPNAVISSIAVGMNPTEVAFSPDGSTAYVTNFGSGTVSVLAQVVVGSAVPAAGTVGSAYSFQVPAVHATGFTVAGVLPAGLSLDPSTDVISGTPTTAGTSTFTVTAIGYSQASKPQSTDKQGEGVLS